MNDAQYKNFREFTRDQVFKLVMEKVVYSYEYMDSWEKFKERKQPPKNAFKQQPEHGVGKCYLRRLL